MRKNGSKLISLQQYRFTDMFLFAVILAVFDVLAHFAPIWLSGGQSVPSWLLSITTMFTFTLTVPITLLIMMRWGWPSVFFAVFDGLLLSVLNNPTVWQSYVSFPIGCSFMMLLLLATKYIGKEKIASKWYFSALFVLAGWVLMNLGITLVQAACGLNILTQLTLNFGLNGNGLMALAVGLILILVMRKLDGMFEDQKHYLIRLDKERKERMRRDTFGDEPIDIDEETLSALKKWDDDMYL